MWLNRIKKIVAFVVIVGGAFVAGWTLGQVLKTSKVVPSVEFVGFSFNREPSQEEVEHIVQKGFNVFFSNLLEF